MGTIKPRLEDYEMHLTVFDQFYDVIIVSGLKLNKNIEFLSIRKLFDTYVSSNYFNVLSQ